MGFWNFLGEWALFSALRKRLSGSVCRPVVRSRGVLPSRRPEESRACNEPRAYHDALLYDYDDLESRIEDIEPCMDDIEDMEDFLDELDEYESNLDLYDGIGHEDWDSDNWSHDEVDTYDSYGYNDYGHDDYGHDEW